MHVLFRTFGCKANQYDTERMRQEAEALGASGVSRGGDAQVCVVNTCTVTNQADADARRFIRRIRRENPGIQVVVAGCSSALKPEAYRAMDGVVAVVEGHDPVEVAQATVRNGEGAGCRPIQRPEADPGLVQLKGEAAPKVLSPEPRGGDFLRRREGGTRGWLKIQDGCDRKCSFCATRLARGKSRSRPASELVQEARLMSRVHPELVRDRHERHVGDGRQDRLAVGRDVLAVLRDAEEVRRSGFVDVLLLLRVEVVAQRTRAMVVDE